MTGRFEAHITFPKHTHKHVEAAGEREGWVFSAITGCPLLGQGDYCYLTSYDTDSDKLLASMDTVAATLAKQGIIALRLKIERIVYDTKTGVDELHYVLGDV